MNTETTKPAQDNVSWGVVQSNIKARFSKLTGDQIAAVKENMGQLSSKLQIAYGYAKEKADREVEDFKVSQRASNLSSKKDVKHV